jgi:ABC-2 type transport system ATP-binding protein
MAIQAALATHDLCKSYGSRRAVDHLNLVVERGEIFGFLGPNGAGKTTTIRMALGLIRPTEGRVEVLGEDVRRARSHVLPRVGALIESPALYDYMSGRANLQAFASVLGGVPRGRIDEVLEIVDLTGRQKDLVSSYSMGMKQRLGVAAALLNDPELLVLDEPANGLDPAGIVEMRDLLRTLVEQGKTIFVSSHVLAEVQQICDRVAIINLGKLVKVAPIADLVRGHGEFEVAVEDAMAVLTLVRSTDWGAAARLDDGVLVTAAPGGRGRELVRFLTERRVYPDRVNERQQNLEEIFLSLTGTNGAIQ